MRNRRGEISLLGALLILALIVIATLAFFMVKISKEINEKNEQISNLTMQVNKLNWQIIKSEDVSDNENEKAEVEENNDSDITAGNNDDDDIDIIDDTEFQKFLLVVTSVNRNNLEDASWDELNDEEYYDTKLINIACDGVYKNWEPSKDEKIFYVKKENVNSYIEEIFGESIDELTNINDNLVWEYNSERDAYEVSDHDINNGTQILKIDYEEDSNEVKVIYAFTSENEKDNIDCYETTIKFDINETYKYSKYQLENGRELINIPAGKISDYK